MRDRRWAVWRRAWAISRRPPPTPSTPRPTPMPPIRRRPRSPAAIPACFRPTRLNFTGKTTIAVTDSSGNLVSRVDVDFDAGTLSVDGGAQRRHRRAPSAASPPRSTPRWAATARASFANGELSIAATGGNGIVVQDDATTPSSRGGTGFSQFFGLNDLFQSQAPSILSTGLSASRCQRLGGGRHDRAFAQGPGRRHRQAGQRHHHRRHDHRRCA